MGHRIDADDLVKQSRHRVREQSQSLDPQAGRELLAALDPWSGIRNALGRIAEERSEWAGIPLPIEGQPLVVEKNYPNAAELSQIGAAKLNDENQDTEFADCKIRNTFWSWHRRSNVHIWQKVDGTVEWGISPGVHSVTQQLNTLGASDVWSLETESIALQTLGTLIRHRQFKQYLLTGSFLETSKRSGVTYLFRKLRPTVALASRTGQTRILCALCLHAIGYYTGSWAGAMCPTDDVISHLMLMRGDEHLFWRRANQHPSWRPEAGL